MLHRPTFERLHLSAIARLQAVKVLIAPALTSFLQISKDLLQKSPDHWLCLFKTTTEVRFLSRDTEYPPCAKWSTAVFSYVYFLLESPRSFTVMCFSSSSMSDMKETNLPFILSSADSLPVRIYVTFYFYCFLLCVASVLNTFIIRIKSYPQCNFFF